MLMKAFASAIVISVFACPEERKVFRVVDSLYLRDEQGAVFDWPAHEAP